MVLCVGPPGVPAVPLASIAFWYAVQISAAPPSNPAVASNVMSSGPFEPAGGAETKAVLGKVLGCPRAEPDRLKFKVRVQRKATKQMVPIDLRSDKEFMNCRSSCEMEFNALQWKICDCMVPL